MYNYNSQHCNFRIPATTQGDTNYNDDFMQCLVRYGARNYTCWTHASCPIDPNYYYFVPNAPPSV